MAMGKRSLRVTISITGRLKAGKPLGISATISTPFMWSFSDITAKILNTTTTNAPGIFLLMFRITNSIRIAIAPMPNAYRFIGFNAENSSISIRCSLLFLPASIPNKWLSWLEPIISAAAEVNPLMTGVDKKLTKNPILNIPSTNCRQPTNNANTIAMAI